MGTPKYGDFKRKMEALRMKPRVIFSFKEKKQQKIQWKKEACLKILKENYSVAVKIKRPIYFKM